MRIYKKKTDCGSYVSEMIQHALKAVQNAQNLKGATRVFNIPPRTLRSTVERNQPNAQSASLLFHVGKLPCQEDDEQTPAGWSTSRVHWKGE
jgi:hypothetical protein